MVPASRDSQHGEPLSRREVIQGAAALGLALATPAALATEGAILPLITKPIPSTGEQLPVIGVGTNRYSVTSPADIEARKEVLRALPQLGGKLIDTAAAYGDAEVVIGKLVKELGNRDLLFIATKTPWDLEGGANSVVERALTRLQTSKIDLLQVHNFFGFDELLPVLYAAKRAGKVRYVGATTSFPRQHPQMLDALKNHHLDFIQVDYSLEDRTSEPVLEAAHEKRVAVLANLPLGRAALLEKVKGKPLPDWAKEIDVSSWAQLFLKYVVSHPAITAAIPGTTKLAHLQDNQLAARGRLPDEGQRKKIESYWASL